MKLDQFTVSPDEFRRWCQRRGAVLVVLFGSYASGQPHAQSDIDLAVSFVNWPEPRQRLAIIGELEDLFKNSVDVVFLRPNINPVLMFEIFRQGVPLYEHEAGHFEQERLRAWHLYNDALPARRALRASLRRTIEEWTHGA